MIFYHTESIIVCVKSLEVKRDLVDIIKSGFMTRSTPTEEVLVLATLVGQQEANCNNYWLLLIRSSFRNAFVF